VSEALFLRLVDRLAGEPAVELSFDDGNRSDVATALPALVERGLTGRFFPLAGRLRTRGSLDPADLRALVAAGMTLGSHGMDHIPWRRLDAATRHREFTVAREALAEAAGAAISEVALPFGQYDRATLLGLRRRGYRHAFSSDRLRVDPTLWFQPRFSVHQGDTVDTVVGHLRRTSRRQELLTRAKIGVKRLR
jgi:peptidoglycan/xylan/chitin deacetylase (PgdA/CDA1 family)